MLKVNIAIAAISIRIISIIFFEKNDNVIGSLIGLKLLILGRKAIKRALRGAKS